MHYTLHQLKVFVETVNQQSITKAAESLHLTQPAVSIQMKNFQDQFEVPLIEIIGRQLHVTDFGEEVAATARRILAEVEHIETQTLAYKGMLKGDFKISIVSTGKYIMPYFLSGFLQLHKGVALNMDVTNKQQVIEDLENNIVDFALVSILPKSMDLNYVELMENKLYLVGRKSNSSSIPPVSKMPFIYREQGSATRQVMEEYLAKRDHNNLNNISLTSNEAVKQAILAGLGYSIMPIIGLKNELRNNQLEIIDTKGLPINTTWRLVWHKGKRLSPIASAYLEHLGENKNKIIEDDFTWYEEVDGPSTSSGPNIKY